MKKIKLCLLGLIVVLASTQIAITNPDMGAYDPRADTDKDGDIDYDDFIVLAGAYGSTGLGYQENKTVITVYNETSPIENARIAIVDSPSAIPFPEVLQVAYTNSSGFSNFTLSPDTNYISIVWSGSTYNYANFTTNSLGEAYVSITLGSPNLPVRYWVFTVINLTTGELAANVDFIAWENIAGYNNAEQKIELGPYCGTVETQKGVGIFNAPAVYPSQMPIVAYTDTGATLEKASGCMVDENCTANLVIYI